MQDKEEQRVTAEGVAKKLMHKVESLDKSLRDDMELLDYIEPAGSISRSRLEDVKGHLADVKRHLRSAIEGS